MVSQRYQGSFKTPISSKQSKVLLKDAIALCLYNITFLRSVFGHANFLDERYVFEHGSISKPFGPLIKRLKKGVSEEADKFIAIIEECAVFIDQDMLQGIEFRIVSADRSEVSELYLFQVGKGILDSNLFYPAGIEEESSGWSLERSVDNMMKIIRKVIVSCQGLVPFGGKKKINLILYQKDSKLDTISSSVFSRIKSDSKGTLRIGCQTVDLNLSGFSTGLDSTEILMVSNMYVNDDDTITNMNDVSIWNDKLIMKAPLSRIKTSIVFPSKVQLTKHVPPQGMELSLYEGDPTCECESSRSCVSHASKKGYIMLECKRCSRKIHSSCYGYAQASTSKRHSSKIICYTCLISGTDLTISDIQPLMRVRHVWKLFSGTNLPSNLHFFFSLFQLKDNETASYLINKLLSQDIVIPYKSPFTSSSSGQVRVECTKVQIDLDKIFYKGEHLQLGSYYYFAFAPRLKTARTDTKLKEVRKFYFPNVLADISALKSILKKFHSLEYSMESDEEDPIICTSSQNSSARTSKRESSNSIVEGAGTSLADFTFEESLNFLSQTSHYNNDFANLLQEEVHNFKNISEDI